MPMLLFFIAGYIAGVTTLFALAVWYCSGGGQIMLKEQEGEDNGEQDK
jgi:hypothetical protein